LIYVLWAPSQISVFLLLQLKQKISSATSAIKSVFGQEENKQQDAVSEEMLNLGLFVFVVIF